MGDDGGFNSTDFPPIFIDTPPASSSEAYLALDPTMKQSIFCYRAMMATSAGVWLGNNPLHFSFPILLYQLILVFIATRATHAVLRHLSQPQVISQIIAGMLLGPTFIGQSMAFEKLLYSNKTWEHLNTIAMLSFVFFVFMVGVKTDLSMVRKTGKRAVAIAIGSSLLPFCLVLIIGYLLRHRIPRPLRHLEPILTFNFRWSVTSYCVLTCTLSELHLLTSKLGRLAMSASLIADFLNIVASVGVVAYMIGANDSVAISVSSFVTFVGFMGFIVLVARPVTVWIIRKTPEGNLLDEASFVAVIFMILLVAFLSEAVGLHVTLGPFVFGLVLPGGAPLGVTLVEKMERLVVGVFLPLYVVQAGLRVDLPGMRDTASWGFMLLLVVVSTLGKFFGSMGVCLYCKMPLRDAASVSLMNIQKGILEVDNISFWLDARTINRQVYTLYMLSVVVLGGGTAPLIKYMYRPEDRFVAHKRRTVQHAKPHTELRVLACIYHEENVNSVLSLLQSSHPSTDSPICIYVLHLTQLAGRAAAVLAPYKPKKQRSSDGGDDSTETDHIVNAFNYFAQQHHGGCVTVIPYTCLSPYSTMHDDICSLALDKKVALVLVPFHKHLAIDDTIESINPAIQNVNVNVLHYSPCSVAILVFHGQHNYSSAPSPAIAMTRHVAVYFIGGPDDREALAYGARMAEDSSIGLTLVRFRLPKEARDGGREERLDDVMVEEFRTGKVDGSRVVYREEVVMDGEGTVAVIRAISSHFNLLIVGRREGKESRLTEGLSMWNEYPELGIVGDLLASTDFGKRVATLVVQQQTRYGTGGGGGEQSESPKVLQEDKARVVPAEFDD